MRRIVLATLLALATLAGTAAASDYKYIHTYVLSAGAAGDSVAGGTNWHSDWFPVFGAKMVQILVKCSTTSTAYVDSIGYANLHISHDEGTTLTGIALGSYTWATNTDSSFYFSFVGKLDNEAMSTGSAWKTALIVPTVLAAQPVPFLTVGSMQLRLIPTARKRQPASTGNAAMNRLRVLVRVFYDGPSPSFGQ